MGDRTFRATCGAGIFMSIPLFSVMLFLPQYFSKVQGYGAFEANDGDRAAVGERA
jgi:hypothetical protein